MHAKVVKYSPATIARRPGRTGTSVTTGNGPERRARACEAEEMCPTGRIVARTVTRSGSVETGAGRIVARATTSEEESTKSQSSRC